jgi:plastocyanin
MTVMRRLKLLIPAALFLATACGELPDSTEQARGVFSGLNIVLAMSVLVIVLAVGLVVGAVTLDRIVRTRRALAEGPPADIEEDEADEGDEVVAGITVGRAPVPRWLYAAYVLIPLFAFAYVFSNVRPPQAAEDAATPEPTGPCEECEIAAVPPIAFDKAELTVPPSTEITVAFSNDEQGVPHTFTVWETKADAGGGEPVVDSGNVAGGAERDVQFESPDSGTWYFNCTIHPAMEGDIVVEG